MSIMIFSLVSNSSNHPLVLSKATGYTLQKHYECDYDRENKIHALSYND